MKKLLILLFAMLIAISASAQTLSGSIESGLKVVNTSTGTTVQHFSWGSGGTGWGKVKLAAVKDNTSLNIHFVTADSLTVSIPALWLTQSYFEGKLSTSIGKIDNNAFSTPYQDFGGVGTQGVMAIGKFGDLSVGASVPLNNVAQPFNSLEQFKAGASFSLKPVSLVASYYNAASPVVSGSVSATVGQFWLGTDVQNTAGLTTISPYVDYTNKAGNFNATLDIWTDTGDLVKNSETALWLNYWFKPEFRVLGRVIYTGAGNIKTREGFIFKPSASTALRAQVDSDWTAKTHTLNAYIVQSF